MNHSFNVELATKYGIEESIFIEHIAFWIKKNIANGKNYHDGYYWTYNSARAFSEIFEYMSESKIQRVLKVLEKEGIIKTGNYNKISYDRTKWYTIIDKSIQHIYKLHSAKMTNGSTQNNETIPDINTDINTSIKKNIDFSLEKSVSANKFKITDREYFLLKKIQSISSKFKKHKIDRDNPTKTIRNAISILRDYENGIFPKNKYFKETWIKRNKIDLNTFALGNQSLEKDIIKAVERFEKMCSQEYAPTNKDILPRTLDSFLYNPRGQTSFFLLCLQHEPEKTETATVKETIDALQKNLPVRVLKAANQVYNDCIRHLSWYKPLTYWKDVKRLYKWQQETHEGLRRANPNGNAGRFGNAEALFHTLKTYIERDGGNIYNIRPNDTNCEKWEALKRYAKSKHSVKLEWTEKDIEKVNDKRAKEIENRYWRMYWEFEPDMKNRDNEEAHHDTMATGLIKQKWSENSIPPDVLEKYRYLWDLLKDGEEDYYVGMFGENGNRK